MLPLRIIRGLGGNGSTFLSRVIASMERVVLLSETNPLSANLFAFGLNPATQITSNYHHLNLNKYSGHIAELGAPELFGKYVNELLTECELIDHTLVIRDYNYVDYIGTPLNWHPPLQSSLDKALGSLSTQEILLIRHPIPQFMSLSSHEELKNALDYRAFLKGYRAMLDVHRAAEAIRYEDLFAAFDQRMPELAAHLLLPLSPDWKTRISSIDWVTGHALGKTSASPELRGERLNSEMRDLFLPVEDYRVICETCGYEP